MPYTYLEDIATADVAFQAWGQSPEEMLVAAAEATMNVMVESMDTISDHEERSLKIQAESLEMLLFELLQELIYYKDADQLLLRVPKLSIQEENGQFVAIAKARGEKLDPAKHGLNADVKAVTMHRFRVGKTDRGWEATVVLDI